MLKLNSLHLTKTRCPKKKLSRSGNGLIKARKHKRKQNKTYEAPKYLPGEKVQVDLKYVRLVDEIAQKYIRLHFNAGYTDMNII